MTITAGRASRAAALVHPGEGQLGITPEVELAFAGQSTFFTLIGATHRCTDHEGGDEGGDEPRHGDDQQSRHLDLIGLGWEFLESSGGTG